MKKIQPGYLAQQAADRIREMIRSGRLKTGDRIREEPMCAAMGVSRTPLREALRILSSEGLIESIPNRSQRSPRAVMRAKSSTNSWEPNEQMVSYSGPFTFPEVA